MSSCFGSRRSGDREPLLPQYNDDTSMQRTLHQKLHSYQMVRALTKGFMPSTEQLIINLRTLLGSDVLNPTETELSDSGRLLAKFSKQWVQQFIDMLKNKNSEDQIQDFIWFLANSRLSVDVKDLTKRASKVKARADTMAAYRSLQTVGSLLLTNSDFRIFLSDLRTAGREVFKDSAFAISKAADKAGNEIGQDGPTMKETDAGEAPSQEELVEGLENATKVVGNQAVEVAKETQQSVVEHLGGEERETLINRLKSAVSKLRQRPDYSDSVSTITTLIKRYAKVYSQAAEEAVNAIQEDVSANEATSKMLENLWALAGSFGDKKEWDELQQRFKKVAEHRQSSPEFENVMNEVGDSVEKVLKDPDFLQNINQKVGELRKKFNELGSDSTLRPDIESLIEQVQTTFTSIMNDDDVSKMLNTTFKIANILSPVHSMANTDLLQDTVNVFGPLLIQAIQYIPIPRLEVSVPEVDLLLENLIIEPGVTINHSSFLPFRFRIETYNDLEIRKARMRTVSKVKSLVTVKIDGLSVRADEIGFWLRAHSGILRLADEGIASFQMDERGMDIHLDVEVGEEKLEKVLSLKAVRVKVHKLSYDLRKSKFAWLAWLVKPLLRPILRKVIEKQAATAIADFFHAANRELLFARERLRATRISDPKDLMTFFKAVAARLTPEDDPDVYTRLGVAQPGKGVFKGVYAPGSIVKIWNEEAMRAGEVVDDYDQGAWRNDIFEVQTTTAY